MTDMTIIEHDDGTYTRKWTCACHQIIEVQSSDGGYDIVCECDRYFNCFCQQLQTPHYGYEDY